MPDLAACCVPELDAKKRWRNKIRSHPGMNPHSACKAAPRARSCGFHFELNSDHLLQSTQNSKKVCGAGIPMRTQHAMQTLAGYPYVGGQFLKSHCRVNKIF